MSEILLQHVTYSCKEVVLAAVNHNGLALKYASDELQNNKEVILTAIENNHNVLEDLSNELKNDKEFLIECYKKNRNTYKINRFIKQFHRSNCYLTHKFVHENIDILHLHLLDKKRMCDYLINNSLYYIVFCNEHLSEYFKYNTKFDYLPNSKKGLCDFLIIYSLYDIIFENEKITEYLKNNTKFDYFFWDYNKIDKIGSIINLAMKYLYL